MTENYYATSQADSDCPTASLLAARRIRAAALIFQIVGWPSSVFFSAALCVMALFLCIAIFGDGRLSVIGVQLLLTAVTALLTVVSYYFIRIARKILAADARAKTPAILLSILLLLSFPLLTPLGAFCLYVLIKHYDDYDGKIESQAHTVENPYAAPQADLDCPTLSLLAARRIRAVAIMFRVVGWPMTIFFGLGACVSSFLLVWSWLTERKTDFGFIMGICVALSASALGFHIVQVARFLEKGKPTAKQPGLMYATFLLFTGLLTPLGVLCLVFISKYFDEYCVATNPELANHKVDARPIVQTVIRLFRWIGWPFLFLVGFIAFAAFLASLDVRNPAGPRMTVVAIISVIVLTYCAALLIAAKYLKRGRRGAKWFGVALSAPLLPGVPAFTVAGVYCIVALLSSYDDYCDQLENESEALQTHPENQPSAEDVASDCTETPTDSFASEDVLPSLNPKALPIVSVALFLGGACGAIAGIFSATLLMMSSEQGFEAFPAPADRAVPFILAISGIVASIGTLFAAPRMYRRDLSAKPVVAFCLFVGIFIGAVLVLACGPIGLLVLVPSVAGLGAVRIVYTDDYCNPQDEDDVFAADAVETENES